MCAGAGSATLAEEFESERLRGGSGGGLPTEHPAHAAKSGIFCTAESGLA